MPKSIQEKLQQKSVQVQRYWFNIFFCLALVVIVSLNLVSYWEIKKIETANDWLIHSYKVINSTNNILLNLFAASTKIRGFIITRDRRFVEGITDYYSDLEKYFSETKALTVDKLNQQQKIASLAPLIKAVIKNFQTMQFNVHIKTSPSEVDELVNINNELLNKIQAIANEFYNNEALFLQKRKTTVWNSSAFYLLLNIAQFFNIAVVLLMIYFLNRQLSKSIILEKYASNTLYELERHDQEISLINDMNAALQASLSIGEIYEWIKKYCIQLLPITSGILYIANPSKNFLELKAQWNTPKVVANFFHPDQCWALRQGKLYKFLDKDKSIPCKHLSKANPKTPYFCIPLLAHNDMIGLLYIEFKKFDDIPKNQIIHLLKTYESILYNIADHIALAISNIKLRDILKNSSLHDPLTTLYNRAYLDEYLLKDILLAKREKNTISIIMIDIDHFKDINDKFGHEAGNFVLKQFAQVILNHIRETDIACRYGGEEFLLLFSDVSLKETAKILESLRKKISEIKLQFGPQLIDPITASMGVAMYPEHATDAVGLIVAADKALYQSKKTGRNKVTIYIPNNSWGARS
jgi:diguanylate cyclase (GGDEF)-like protein